MNTNMNFEDMKKNWQTQAVNAVTDSNEFRTALDSKWQKHQQKVLRMNICLSLAFLAAMIVIGWVYFSFKDEYHWPFQISIAFCLCVNDCFRDGQLEKLCFQ